jgi:hypothetical protein
MLPTTLARMAYDYARNGTTSLFAAFDLAGGSVTAQPCRRHRHQEFPRFLKLTDAAVPRDLELYLVHPGGPRRLLPQGQRPGTLGGPPAESGRNASTRCCP